jgi:hypothetical protein
MSLIKGKDHKAKSSIISKTNLKYESTVNICSKVMAIARLKFL